MKFDPFSWDEVKPNVEVQVGKGPVRIMCAAPTALYISAQGVEALAGVGTSHDVEVSEPVTVKLDAPKGVRCFIFNPPLTTAVQPHGEVYTNVDRMVEESGTMAEITRARRQFELERRAMLREMRVEHARLQKAMKADTPREAASPPVVEQLYDGSDPEPVKGDTSQQQRAAKE